MFRDRNGKHRALRRLEQAADTEASLLTYRPAKKANGISRKRKNMLPSIDRDNKVAPGKRTIGAGHREMVDNKVITKKRTIRAGRHQHGNSHPHCRVVHFLA